MMLSDRPNILYIVCHDLGRHLGCYGAAVESPNLDRFAAEGIRFTQAHCNSTACSPSRACAMTGMYAHCHGQIGLAHMGWPLPDSIRTVVDELNDTGYETAHFGFSHERHPLRNRYQIDGQRHWRDNNVSAAVPQAIDYLRRWASRRRAGDAPPFYLNLGTNEVHAHRWGQLSLGEVRERWGHGPDPRDIVLPPYLPDLPVTREAFAKLAACIGHLDDCLGRLFAELQALDLFENTLVIFTTDHGLPSNRGKGTLYDAGTEIALLVRPPGRASPRQVVNHLIQNIDTMPALLDAAGVPVPDRVQGRSWWPLVTGRGDAYVPHRRIFTERNYHGERRVRNGRFAEGYVDCYDPIRAVRDDRWHYIRNYAPDSAKPWTLHDFRERPDQVVADQDETWDVFPFKPPRTGRPTEELYDTWSDPLELDNRANDAACADLRRDLAAALDQWMRQTHDFAPAGSPPSRHAEPGWGCWPVDA